MTFTFGVDMHDKDTLPKLFRTISGLCFSLDRQMGYSISRGKNGEGDVLDRDRADVLDTMQGICLKR